MSKVYKMWKADVKPLLNKLEMEEMRKKNYHWAKHISRIINDFEEILKSKKESKMLWGGVQSEADPPVYYL